MTKKWIDKDKKRNNNDKNVFDSNKNWMAI